jgi:hypothetical protein
MGLLTRAKCKLEENWPVSLSKAIMKVEGFRMWDRVKSPGLRKITSSFTRRHAMKGNGTEGKTPRKGKNLNNFKARVSNLKGISSRRGFLLKRTNPRGMLVGSPKECASIAMKWDTTPKITPNLNLRMGALR